MSDNNLCSGHPPMAECDHDECGIKCKRESASPSGSAAEMRQTLTMCEQWMTTDLELYRSTGAPAGMVSAIEYRLKHIRTALGKPQNGERSDAKRSLPRIVGR